MPGFVSFSPLLCWSSSFYRGSYDRILTFNVPSMNILSPTPCEVATMHVQVFQSSTETVEGEAGIGTCLCPRIPGFTSFLGMYMNYFGGNSLTYCLNASVFLFLSKVDLNYRSYNLFL